MSGEQAITWWQSSSSSCVRQSSEVSTRKRSESCSCMRTRAMSRFNLEILYSTQEDSFTLYTRLSPMLERMLLLSVISHVSLRYRFVWGGSKQTREMRRKVEWFLFLFAASGSAGLLPNSQVAS